MVRRFIIFVTSFLPAYVAIWGVYLARYLTSESPSNLFSTSLILSSLGIALLLFNFFHMMKNVSNISSDLIIAKDTLDATFYVNGWLWVVQLMVVLFGISGRYNLLSLIIIIIISGVALSDNSMLFATPLLTIFASGHLYIITIDDPDSEEPLPLMLIAKGTVEDGDVLKVYISEEDVFLAEKVE